MSISDKDLQRMIEFMDNHETRLRRLETQEIGVGVLGTGMTLIQELTPTGATADFTSIPSTYRHLQLRWIAKSDLNGYTPTISLTYNADSGSSYWATYHIGLLAWSGSDIHSVNAESSGPAASIALGQIPGILGEEDESFGWGIADINYYTISIYKSLLVHSGTNDEVRDNARTFLASGRWDSTATINQITISMTAGQDFVTPTTFSLYGIS